MSEVPEKARKNRTCFGSWQGRAIQISLAAKYLFLCALKTHLWIELDLCPASGLFSELKIHNSGRTN